jgi:hypothetical protein
LLQRDAKGDVWLQTEVPLPEGSGIGKSVAIGDTDGDGKNELIVSTVDARGKHSVFGLHRGGPSAWSAFAVSGQEGTKFDRIDLFDIDEDGDLDVLTCEERENFGVFWYENPRAQQPVGPVAVTK